MPYKADPALPTPARERTLWRYVDLPRLTAMLLTSSLHLPSVEALDDPFEGSLSSDHQGITELFLLAKQWPPERAARARTILADANRALRARSFVSCWHMSTRESDAMWRLYGGGREGVALSTTVGRLMDAVAAIPLSVFIGTVQYVDYTSARLPSRPVHARFFYKRDAFAHENEVRMLVRMREDSDAPSLSLEWVGGEELDEDSWTVRVPISVSALVQEVVVAPAAPRWYEEVVIGLLRRCEHQLPVRRSTLEQRPIF